MAQDFHALNAAANPGQREDATVTGALDWRIFCAFADENPDVFAPAFHAWKEGRKAIGAFCWPAFFAPFAWLLYRKMYGVAAIWAAAPIAVSMFTPYAAMAALAMILNGVFGHRFYIRLAGATIRSIQSASRTQEEAQHYFQRAAGVSLSGAILGAFITLAVWLVSAASLFEAIYSPQ